MEIARLCFHRAIKSSYHRGENISFQLSMHSEFSGVILGLMEKCTLAVRSISSDGDISDCNLNYSFRTNGDVCIFKFAPFECCAIVLEFYCIECPTGVEVLSLRSEQMTISENCEPKIICSVFRSLIYHDNIPTSHKILIKEDRGLTMGSHLWDSAIVIFHHFNDIMASSSHANTSQVGVELGAGCGLTAVQMAKCGMFSHIYCTDIARQIPLIEENIFYNGVCSLVTAHELDWCEKNSLDRFQGILSDQNIDTIFAADVLYQPEIFHCLLSVIDTLAQPEHTAIFIAQKIRGERNTQSVDLTQLSTYNCELILSESSVLVWKLVKCASK